MSGMILTIWRHGQAGSAATDRQRELTRSGRDDLARACRRFQAICRDRSLPLPDLVLFSAWLRTTQTAGIICDAMDVNPPQPCAALLPASDVHTVDKALGEVFESPNLAQHLLLVSHQPLVSRLVDHYLGDFGRVPSLAPGGLATLSLAVPAPACAQLLFWAMPPDYRAGV